MLRTATMSLSVLLLFWHLLPTAIRKVRQVSPPQQQYVDRQYATPQSPEEEAAGPTRSRQNELDDVVMRLRSTAGALSKRSILAAIDTNHDVIGVLW